MIYDCFTFFNELELLELRLHELGDVVDKFVLVEATRTFTNKPKPLHYQENRHLFREFHDKIIHIVVDDMPDVANPWLLEHHQRNCIARGLVHCRPDDLVLVSDLDEIPRAATVARVTGEMRFSDDFFSNAAHAALNSRFTKSILHRKGFRWKLRKNHPFILKFQQQFCQFFLNGRLAQTPHWLGTRMLYFRDYSTAEEIRHSGYKIVPDGGWHFTYMGGGERIRDKLAAYAHQENNRPQFADPQVLTDLINRGDPVFSQNEKMAYVPLDDSFPRYVREHPEKFAAWIKLV